MSHGFFLNGQWSGLPTLPTGLVDVLRRHHHQVGTKAPCREGDCGACQVLVGRTDAEGCWHYRAELACLLRGQDVEGASVVTVEAFAAMPQATANPAVAALSEAGASQCGYCSPGLLLATVGWLLDGTTLDESEGAQWLNANLCRCTGYMGQRRAIRVLAGTFGAPLRAASDRVALLVEAGVIPAFLSTLQRPPALTRPDASSTPEGRTPAFLGGGTDALLASSGLPQAPSVLRSGGSGEPAVREDGQGLWLSARHALTDLEAALEQSGQLPALVALFEWFGSVAVRRRATLGGNLAHASPVADSLPLLLALEALVVTDQRQLPVDELVVAPHTTLLAPGERIEWIGVPSARLKDVIHVDKVSRRPHTDISVASMAGVWTLSDGHVEAVRLALGGCTAVPVRLTALEERLRGCALSDDIGPGIDALVQPAIHPLTDVRGSALYRRRLARQLVLSQWDALQSHREACRDPA